MAEEGLGYRADVVPFYGDELVAIEREDGTVFVVFARLCDNLGVNRQSQARKVREHGVLSKGFEAVSMATPGGNQAVQCLRLDLLPLWLTTIQTRNVKADSRPKLERYQTEAAAVLWNHFRPRVVRQPESAAMQQLQQIAEMGRAITAMAEQQMELQRRQEVSEARLDKAAAVVKDIQVRLGLLEDRLQPAAYITDEQATEVSNAVKALAELLTGKDPSKNQYQSIFAELYRRFGVSSYKNIRQGQYGAVLKFLEDWSKAALGQQQ